MREQGRIDEASDAGMEPTTTDDRQEQEVQKPRMMRRPQEPSRREWEEHQLTHMPFRDWCPFCVRGKAKAQGHGKEGDRDRNVEMVTRDYMWM
eukprot:5376-Alexandrium_andersonii.AAC.1